jgi:hypothetical protein
MMTSVTSRSSAGAARMAASALSASAASTTACPSAQQRGRDRAPLRVVVHQQDRQRLVPPGL